MADRNRDDDASIGVDGLPIDPTKRAAAVAAQFDDFNAQAAALTPSLQSVPLPAADVGLSDAGRATELLVQFKGDLARLYLSDAYQAWPQVVIMGMLDVAEAMMRRGVRAEPQACPILLSRIDLMRSRVRAVLEPVKIPTGLAH